MKVYFEKSMPSHVLAKRKFFRRWRIVQDFFAFATCEKKEQLSLLKNNQLLGLPIFYRAWVAICEWKKAKAWAIPLLKIRRHLSTPIPWFKRPILGAIFWRRGEGPSTPLTRLRLWYWNPCSNFWPHQSILLHVLYTAVVTWNLALQSGLFGEPVCRPGFLTLLKFEYVIEISTLIAAHPGYRAWYGS